MSDDLDPKGLAAAYSVYWCDPDSSVEEIIRAYHAASHQHKRDAVVEAAKAFCTKWDDYYTNPTFDTFAALRDTVAALKG